MSFHPTDSKPLSLYSDDEGHLVMNTQTSVRAVHDQTPAQPFVAYNSYNCCVNKHST